MKRGGYQQQGQGMGLVWSCREQLLVSLTVAHA